MFSFYLLFKMLLLFILFVKNIFKLMKNYLCFLEKKIKKQYKTIILKAVFCVESYAFYSCFLRTKSFKKINVKAMMTNVSTVCSLKGCVCYIFASLFLSPNKSICLTMKSVFHFTSFWRKSHFRIYRNCHLKTSSRPFCVSKELSTTCIGK